MPTAERKARGTYQPSRDAAGNVAQTVPGEPPMPAGMSKGAVALWLWLAPRLVAAGVLDERDGATLEEFCRERARWDRLQKIAENELDADEPSFGPANAVALKLHKDVIQPLAAALGLHYLARSRMRKPDSGDKGDPVADELFGPLGVVDGGKA